MKKYIVYLLTSGFIGIEAEKVYEEGEFRERVVFTVKDEPVGAFLYANIAGWIETTDE